MGPRLKRGKELRAEDGEESPETEIKGGNFLIVVLEDERERIERDMTDTEVHGKVGGGSVHARARLQQAAMEVGRREACSAQLSCESRNLHRTSTRL